MTPIPTDISINELERLSALAKETATHAHRNQTRKLFADKRAPEPYISHPKALADQMALKFPAMVPVAWLHDVWEDNPEEFPMEKLQQLFPPWIADRVFSLSRATAENYDDYILRVSADEGTKAVKIADLRHNSLDLQRGSLRDKYRLALRLLGEQPSTTSA